MAGGSEVPDVVLAGGHVLVVVSVVNVEAPLGVYAGVSGGRLQLRGRLAHRSAVHPVSHVRRLPGGLRVPVGVGYEAQRAVISQQSADLLAPGHRAYGVAGQDGGVVHVHADQPAYRVGAGSVTRGVARAYRAFACVPSDQSADVGVSGRASDGVARAYGVRVDSRQTADVSAAGRVSGGVAHAHRSGVPSDQAAGHSPGRLVHRRVSGGVALGYLSVVLPHQTADFPVSRHVPGGVACGYVSVAGTRQSADFPVSRHGRRRVAVGSVSEVSAHQSADAGVSRHPARDVAAGYGSAVLSHQSADALIAGYVHVRQPYSFDVSASSAEQAGLDGVGCTRSLEVQVGDSVVVAVEGGAEPGAAGSDGQPAVAAPPSHVCLAGGVAVAVGEVEVLRQFVADAPGGRAAHAGRGVGERLGVGRQIVAERQAVAVQVPADGVQLLQRAYLYEAVVVGVVVAGLRGGVLGNRQRRERRGRYRHREQRCYERLRLYGLDAAHWLPLHAGQSSQVERQNAAPQRQKCYDEHGYHGGV